LKTACPECGIKSLVDTVHFIICVNPTCNFKLNKEISQDKHLTLSNCIELLVNKRLTVDEYAVEFKIIEKKNNRKCVVKQPITDIEL